MGSDKSSDNKDAKKLRTIVYVDGFNMYYGCLKKSPYRWINPVLLCQNILNETHEYVGLKYFSAKVSDTPDDLSKSQRQQIYFRALRTLTNGEVILGHFNVHNVYMRFVEALEYEYEVPGIGRTIQKKITGREVIKYEEKGSDVNIATHMLIDAYDNKYDAAVLISNDSDLKSPLQHIKRNLGKKVINLSPHAQNSIQLKMSSTFAKKIKECDLKKSLFADELEDQTGKFHKPKKW